MLAETLMAELDAYVAAFAARRGGNGHRPLVRSGYPPLREVLTSADATEVTVPRVNDKRTDLATGERKRFSRLPRRACWYGEPLTPSRPQT